MGHLTPEEALTDDIDAARQARLKAFGAEADAENMLDLIFTGDRLMGITPEKQPQHLRAKYRQWIEDNPDVVPRKQK